MHGEKKSDDRVERFSMFPKKARSRDLPAALHERPELKSPSVCVSERVCAALTSAQLRLCTSVTHAWSTWLSESTKHHQFQV